MASIETPSFHNVLTLKILLYFRKYSDWLYVPCYLCWLWIFLQKTTDLRDLVCSNLCQNGPFLVWIDIIVIGRRKPNFELSSFPFAISVPVHDDTGKFSNNIPFITPNRPDPTVNFLGKLVTSGRENVRDSWEHVVGSGPFYWPPVFAKTKTTIWFINLVSFKNISHYTIENNMM